MGQWQQNKRTTGVTESPKHSKNHLYSQTKQPHKSQIPYHHTKYYLTLHTTYPVERDDKRDRYGRVEDSFPSGSIGSKVLTHYPSGLVKERKGHNKLF